MVQKDSIQEAIGTDFAIELSRTVAIALVIVDFNNVAVGQIQGHLQVNNSFGFGKLVNFLKELEVVDLH